MPNYAARLSASKKAEGMRQPLLSEDDDASTATRGSSSGSDSTEFEPYKPTIMQRLKQAVGKYALFVRSERSSACLVHASCAYMSLTSYHNPSIYLSQCLPTWRCRRISSCHDSRSHNHGIRSRRHMHRKCTLCHVQGKWIKKDTYTSIHEQ